MTSDGFVFCQAQLAGNAVETFFRDDRSQPREEH